MAEQQQPFRPADLFFPNRRQQMANGICPVCKGEAKVFKDDLSRKEVKISGMCQKCQDKTFSPPKNKGNPSCALCGDNKRAEGREVCASCANGLKLTNND